MKLLLRRSIFGPEKPSRPTFTNNLLSIGIWDRWGGKSRMAREQFRNSLVAIRVIDPLLLVGGVEFPGVGSLGSRSNRCRESSFSKSSMLSLGIPKPKSTRLTSSTDE